MASLREHYILTTANKRGPRARSAFRAMFLRPGHSTKRVSQVRNQKKELPQAFWGKSRYPVFLIKFDGAESEYDGYQSQFSVLSP